MRKSFFLRHWQGYGCSLGTEWKFSRRRARGMIKRLSNPYLWELFDKNIRENLNSRISLGRGLGEGVGGGFGSKKSFSELLLHCIDYPRSEKFPFFLLSRESCSEKDREIRFPGDEEERLLEKPAPLPPSPPRSLSEVCFEFVVKYKFFRVTVKGNLVIFESFQTLKENQITWWGRTAPASCWPLPAPGVRASVTSLRKCYFLSGRFIIDTAHIIYSV